jgi:hypothetical protein
LTSARLREALKTAHVRRYYWHARRALLDVLCAGNLAALAKVRSESENGMAVVGSVKALEQMRDGMDEAKRSGPVTQTPGLVIVIEGASPLVHPLPASSSTTIEYRPQIEARRVPEREMEPVER